VTASSRLCVLMSPGPKDDLQNPYNQLLIDVLSDLTDTFAFRWRRALLGRWDILHIHWPEAILFGTTRSKRLVKAALFFAVIARARILGRPMVWTVHNIAPHEPLAGLARVAYEVWTSAVSARIHLNHETVALTSGGRPAIDVVIPHGLYPDPTSIPRARLGTQDPGRLLFFGAIRTYKKVPELVRAFAATTDAWTLTVAGEPFDLKLERQLRDAGSGTSRVDIVTRRLAEAELEECLAGADAVVLPYDGLINSGALLLALSRALPVLVPNSPSVRALADEVGRGWIMTFENEISVRDLEAFFRFVSDVDRDKPNLELREWQRIGDAHANLYRKLTA
jgi:beta-1,4-mannosyltransferase